jgi:hypothetical protein
MWVSTRPGNMFEPPSALGFQGRLAAPEPHWRVGDLAHLNDALGAFLGAAMIVVLVTGAAYTKQAALACIQQRL